MKNKDKKYDVFFVDDNEGICRIISDELKTLGCKVRCFNAAQDCLDVLAKKNCDLLITDVKMPGMDGLTLLKHARKIAPWLSVIIITGFGNIPMSVRAMKTGAVDFIEKPLDRKTFLYKVKSILKRDDFDESVAGKMLTKTQKKVLKMILQGKANKEIAYKLDRTVRTVERHRGTIMKKFGTDNIVELVKKAALVNMENSE